MLLYFKKNVVEKNQSNLYHMVAADVEFGMASCKLTDVSSIISPESEMAQQSTEEM